jgi:hypothetical protein
MLDFEIEDFGIVGGKEHGPSKLIGSTLSPKFYQAEALPHEK